MLDTLGDTRMQRLSDALTAVSMPLARLFEYAQNLEQLVDARQGIQATCVAAAIRAEARRAQDEIVASLAAVQQAATEVVSL